MQDSPSVPAQPVMQIPQPTTLPLPQETPETPQKKKSWGIIVLSLVNVLLIVALILSFNYEKFFPENTNQETEETNNDKEEAIVTEKPTFFDKLIKLNNAMPADSNTTSTDGRIPVGLAGTGDVNNASHPAILKINDSLYYVWYEGTDANNKQRIYHARSTDGINWTKYDNSIPNNSDSVSTNGRIPAGTAGKGDSDVVTNPTVVYKDNEFKMWYCGYDGKNRRIFYATSPDALQWTKLDNSIPAISDTTTSNGRIANGTKGKFDEKDACAPEVMWDDDEKIYKMWYSSVVPGNIAMATSSDGLTWTKIDNSVPERTNTTTTNGRIAMGLEGSVDYIYARNPTVVKVNGRYHMWYVGGSPESTIKPGGSQVVVYATSEDGLTWKKYNNSSDTYKQKLSNGIGANGSLLFGTAGTLDDIDFGAADAIYDKGRLFMMIFGNAGTPRKSRIQTVYSIPQSE